MQNSIKIFLSPSKSLNESIFELICPSIPVFEKEASTLIGKLKKLSVGEIKSLMSVSTDIAELNYVRFQSWKPINLNDLNSLQAIRAFSGEVFRGLDFDSLDNNNKHRVNESIFILSGLYGLLKPFDLISPYRLEMGTNFSPNTQDRNLYFYWKQKISAYLLKDLKKEEVIVNLASREYFKVLDSSVLKNRIVTPIFKDLKNGKFTIIMMYAKHARGAMARYIIENKLNSIEDLKCYDIDGYTFEAKQSTENEWLFIR